MAITVDIPAREGEGIQDIEDATAAGIAAVEAQEALSVAAVAAAPATAIEAAEDAILTPVTGTLAVAEAAAIAAVIAEGDTQDARVIAEGDTQDARVIAEGDTQDARVIAEGDTQVARVAATPGSTMYVDTTAGLAATASGGYFLVAGSGNTVATVYKDNAGVAEIQEAYPSVEYVADTERRVAFEAFNRQRATVGANLPKALILIFLGQSNNTQRGTAISTVVSTDAFMPVGGNNLQLFDFHATNAEFTVIHADVASAATHTEGASETPLSGAITTALGGRFARIYTCSVAIGSRTLDILGCHGPRNNLYAVIHQLCDFARAAGYDPVVAYDTVHGEAEMAAGGTEANYYSDGLSYYGMCQLVAAQAMEKPGHLAPIVFHNPIQMKDGSDGATSRGIHNAIRRLARDLPNCIYAGGNYHFDSESDRIHQEETGMRMRGELTGYLIRRFFSEGVREHALEVVDVTWSGTTFTALFNHDVVIDTNYTWGENLNTANAYAGLEWIDNGSAVAVTGATASGRKITGTLTSTPAGTAAQQFLRVASQTTTASLVSGLTNRSGSQIRVDETGRKSIYSAGDANYGIHYRWAVPQICTVRAA